MNYNQLFTQIARQQDKFNQSLFPDWAARNLGWHRASAVELVEMLEHVNAWKWWKGPKPDMPQAQMELVDVLHFMVSEMLTQQDGKHDRVGALLGEYAVLCENPSLVDVRNTDELEEFHQLVDMAIDVAITKHLGHQPALFFKLCAQLDLSPGKLGGLYFAKVTICP